MDMERTRPVRAGDDLREEMETTALARGQLAAWWLTQASWMVKFGNGGFALIDPWWRDLSVDDHWQKLLGEFPLEPEAHPVPDLIACTHWHDDHICPVSIPRLAAAFPATPILIPNRSLELFTVWGVPEDQLVPMLGDDMATVIGPSGAMFEVRAVPAAHMHLDIDENGSNYLSYLISDGDSTVLHMGDSRPWEGWHLAIRNAIAGLGEKLDLAFVCINGNDNLRHDEAVDLALEFEPTLTVPMHYGMDPGNTVDPVIFVDEMAHRAPALGYVVPEVGGLIRVN